MLHKNKCYFFKPGVTQKGHPGVTRGYCTRAIGAPVVTALCRSNRTAIVRLGNLQEVTSRKALLAGISQCSSDNLRFRHDTFRHATFVGLLMSSYFLNKSPMACFITSPPTSAMERVRGMSLGQTSTQFCA